MDNKKKKTRVVIYVRVSTDEQAKHGYSIGAQIEALEAFARSQGWEVVYVFVDDGYSAKDLHRPKFQEMMHVIEQGGIDVLLVYKLDRLTRSVLDLYEVMEFLDKHNCNFRSATEVYDTTNAMGRLFITLVGAIAQWERENLGERIKFGRIKKVNEGKFVGGSAPYGYDYVDDLLVINEEQAKIVRMIFDMALEHTPVFIAKELTKNKVKAPRSNFWNKDTIKNILTNPTYASYVMRDDEPRVYKSPPEIEKLIPAVHDPIVDRNQFWAIQTLIRKRTNVVTRDSSGDYYFTSILYCAQCGRNYIAHRQRNKKGYRCSGQRNGNGCTNGTCGEEFLVEEIFENVDNTDVLNLDSPVESKHLDYDVEELTRELGSIAKKKKKIAMFYAEEIITYDDFRKQVEELKEREREIHHIFEKVNEPSKIEKLNHIRENFHAIWEFANENERKQIVQKLFKRIIIDVKRTNKKTNDIIIKHME